MPKAQRSRQKGKHFYSANSALCKEKEAVKASSRISFLGCVTDNLAVKDYDSSFEYFFMFCAGPSCDQDSAGVSGDETLKENCWRANDHFHRPSR